MITERDVATAAAAGEFDINDEFERFMQGIGLSPEDAGGRITFLGSDPIFQSRHRIAASISIPIMGAAAAAGDITTKDISTFLFPNTFLFIGNTRNCCIVGFHTFDFEHVGHLFD